MRYERGSKVFFSFFFFFVFFPTVLYSFLPLWLDRGTQEGAIIAMVIAGYLAFQHFSRIGNLHGAFEQGSIVATLAIICITVISFLFLI